jgi:hypothetical protein
MRPGVIGCALRNQFLLRVSSRKDRPPVVIAKPVARLRELDEGPFFIGAMLHRIDGETQWRTGFHFPGQDPSVFGVESRVEQADSLRGAILSPISSRDSQRWRLLAKTQNHVGLDDKRNAE